MMYAFIKNIRRYVITAIVLLFFSSCSDFLDIVPDNTITLEDYFANKEKAYNALSNVYAGIPNNHLIHNTEWLLGDDWLGQRDATKAQSGLVGTRIMEGNQNTTSVLLGYWQGSNYATDLYEVIRSANTFLEYIHLVKDLSDDERAQWIAQVKFLKAYYHFILIQHYGPITLIKENVQPNAGSEELFVNRSKIDDCFDYVLELIDEAIPNLDDETMEDELGMINQSIAKAIKARVLLFRASPLFNGNKDLYGDFYDHDGEPYFPMDEEGSQVWTQKWKDALVAVNEAINNCETEGFGLYEYEEQPYKFDMEDWKNNTEAMKRLYSLRLLIVDPWNKECIWGRTYRTGQSGTIQDASNIRLPRTFTNGVQETTGNSWNWAGATFQMVNRYYSKNGLPIEVDKTFDKNNMYRLVSTPSQDSSEYEPLRGILQPDFMTVSMYLNREPRFYANLGITGGYWRGHQYRIDTEMYGGTPGGYDPSVSATDFMWTGVGVQKFVHPESKSGSWIRQIHFPYPIIRMADLYLMKAEILNELNGPGQEVYDEINKIRQRAGIPNVEDVWSNPNLCNSLYLNWHQDKDGLREIILRERSIEFAFEGSRYWDVVRYKKATAEFNTPVTGWTGNAYGQQNFFRLEVKQRRQFLNRNYLWPLSLNEMNTNANLIQNPGW
ncbi:RagB/SusD family nutrient uptake outer membrane protein [Maribellus sp. YY47]|uniref:RagB/SusD family nutrient uptake outer membrane protein n=1 Tax=Maribellus sp. YY47 TaxID=2929486 RepID=UPI002001B81E|nr:RagB/SusD family nutrient uptake outer membrane protein [Maribellus sp. YY47]MCK3684470.1 RagB/SusD family nutrient uptake outer membrane protein [Maribellus sp. YY47]